MNSVELIKKICKDRKIPISKLERDLNYGNGYIGQLKKGTIPSDRAIEIANYLEVDLQYLLSGEKGTEKKEAFITSKDERDIQERIQALCKDRNITVAALERECGLGNATVKKWSISIPSGDRLSKVADYFDVSVDYLLGRELTTRDERDISKDLDRIMNEIHNGENGPLYYNGEEIDKASLGLLQNAIEYALRETKKENKIRYNPTKNKK